MLICTVRQPCGLKEPRLQPKLDLLERSDLYPAAVAQSIPGVPALHQFGNDATACNPADWMLRISEPKSEDAIGVDFAEIFRRSSACR